MSVTVPVPQGRAFGYAEEVAAVRQALLDPARSGCLIIGPPGSGRTTVMNRALDHLEQDSEVFRLRGSELLRDRDLGILEVLLSQTGVSPTVGPGAAVSVVSRIVARGTTTPIVQLDNSNLVDAPSLAVLCQLADARRIRLVAGAESIRPPVDLMAKLWLGGSMARIDLGGLDEAAIAALLESAGQSHLSTTELLRDTGGNPRLVNQVVFGLDQNRAHERILWNIPEELRPILEIVAMVTTAPYEYLADLCSPGETDDLADKGLVTMDRGSGSGVRLSERVIAETLKAHVMPAHSLRLFKLYDDVVDLDQLDGCALFGYLRWGLSLGYDQSEDKVFAAVGAANAQGRYADAAELITASGWQTSRVLLELVRAEKDRGNIAEADRVFGILLDRLAEADDGDGSEVDPETSRYLSRLACMDIRLTNPRTPESLRAQWVRERLTSADDLGRVDVTRARFDLRGGRFAEGLHSAERVYRDHSCLTRHRLRACAILGIGRVAQGRIDLGIRLIEQAELMFGLSGLTSYEREDAAPQIFVARYMAGDWSGARRSVRQSCIGDRMIDFAGALVDVRTGHPARAQSALDALLGHAQETDLIDITWVSRAAKRYVDALLGRLEDPDALVDHPVVEIRPDRYSWWSEFEARLFDLQALALTRPAVAATRLHSLGLNAIEVGGATMAASALMDAARLGSDSAARDLAEVGEDIDGDMGRLARATARGILSDDPHSLLDAARAAVDFGAVVACSELAKLAQKRAVDTNDRGAAREARILIGNSTRSVRFSAVGPRLHALLSEFERKLVEGVMAGRSSQELGRLHHLSARTIEWHLTRIYRRLQVANRRELRDVVSAWGEKP
ncbi:helix-turn-helix transcriptional regulator [Brevibacterium casei]|uniref:helix-turn-helix transcriptional regulator n=1 Tax=Brevibacterium casei TaxID=33889 RepID=UPI0021AFB389|nr:LuxR C-terminal-related transcriptional regulator [Brevibacterium casei]MCT1550187.1 LuxR C-terminal-related transcriptional regulator [Brevibacterium casei]MCT1560105.1 LuxR C-terminal-related transcriptional regulator [Brevibacterium casei]MCT2208259.1 LuxR C-terminal-related transcriptional regulator [Brevibacterium casei]